MTGLGGKSRVSAILRGIGFIGRLLSKKGREKDAHFQAAQDKDRQTTNKVIGYLDENDIR